MVTYQTLSLRPLTLEEGSSLLRVDIDIPFEDCKQKWSEYIDILSKVALYTLLLSLFPKLVELLW